MIGAIVEIDVHGLNVEEAIQRIHKEIDKAGPSVYRIRIIHGFHGGTRIRAAIRDEFYYIMNPKVKNVVGGSNQGITELILREY